MLRLRLPLALGALALAAPASFASGPLQASSDALARAGLRHAAVARLALPDAPLGSAAAGAFGFDLPLHGAEVRVELAPHSDRSEDFRLLVQGADGVVRDVAPAPPATYRGFVVGHPGSAVAASRIGGRLVAQVRLAPGLAPVGIEPLGRFEAGAADEEYLVYDAVDVLPPGRRCAQDTGFGSDAAGTGPEPAPAAPHGPVAPPGAAPAGAASDEAQIAFDADVEYFQKTGSDPFVTQLDIEGKLNSVEAIYETQAGIAYEITAILVRTAEPDPYSTTSPGGLLGQLENHWTSSQAGIQRDQTHLMTGRNLSGGTIGIAELNSICGNNRGYGLSESHFQGANALTSVGLTAHELGHNWNAIHCDGQSDCWIMCSIIGACAGSVTQFGSQSVNRIVNKKNNSSSCLTAPSPAPPVLVGPATPGSVSAYAGGTVSISGEQLGELVEVRVAGAALPDAKWTAAFGELRIVDALFLDVGALSVEVESAGGVAGGVSLDVTESTGVALKGPGLSIPGTSLSYEWSGGAGNTYFFNFSFDGLTSPVGGGFEVLTHANLGVFGTLSPAGTGGFLVASAGSLGFVTIFLQVLVFDTGTGAFVGASDVLPTLFL